MARAIPQETPWDILDAEELSSSVVGEEEIVWCGSCDSCIVGVEGYHLCLADFDLCPDCYQSGLTVQDLALEQRTAVCVSGADDCDMCLVGSCQAKGCKRSFVPGDTLWDSPDLSCIKLCAACYRPEARLVDVFKFYPFRPNVRARIRIDRHRTPIYTDVSPITYQRVAPETGIAPVYAATPENMRNWASVFGQITEIPDDFGSVRRWAPCYGFPCETGDRATVLEQTGLVVDCGQPPYRHRIAAVYTRRGVNRTHIEVMWASPEEARGEYVAWAAMRKIQDNAPFFVNRATEEKTSVGLDIPASFVEFARLMRACTTEGMEEDTDDEGEEGDEEEEGEEAAGEEGEE